MARKSKGAWYWKARNTWYCTIDGQRYNLGPHPEGAAKPRKNAKGEWIVPEEISIAFHTTKSNPNTPAPTESTGGINIGELLDKVLSYLANNKKPRTHQWYEMFFQGFLDFLKANYGRERVIGLEAQAVTGDDIQEWLDAPKSRRAAKSWCPGGRRRKTERSRRCGEHSITS